MQFLMIFTCLALISTYFLVLIVFIVLEICDNNYYHYRGEELSFVEYILEVLINSVHKAITLVAELLADLSYPLQQFSHPESVPVWRILLLISLQIQMTCLINLANLCFFFPLEYMARKLQSLQQSA